MRVGLVFCVFGAGEGCRGREFEVWEWVFGGVACLVSWVLLIWRHPVAGGRCLRIILAGASWFHISVVVPLDFFVMGGCWIEG